MKMAESSRKDVENTVGKGEIARYEQFLLFPPCSRRLVMQTRKNQGLFGKGFIQNIVTIFYAPASKDQRAYSSTVVCLSICSCVCLHKLKAKTKHFPLTPKLILLQGSYLV